MDRAKIAFAHVRRWSKSSDDPDRDKEVDKARNRRTDHLHTHNAVKNLRQQKMQDKQDFRNQSVSKQDHYRHQHNEIKAEKEKRKNNRMDSDHSNGHNAGSNQNQGYHEGRGQHQGDHEGRGQHQGYPSQQGTDQKQGHDQGPGNHSQQGHNPIHGQHQTRPPATNPDSYEEQDASLIDTMPHADGRESAAYVKTMREAEDKRFPANRHASHAANGENNSAGLYPDAHQALKQGAFNEPNVYIV